MNYLWDTNILLHKLRNTSSYQYWNHQYSFFSRENAIYLSIINIGEIESLSFQLNWGNSRRFILQEMINKTTILNIYEETIQAYARIDAFSQNKLSGNLLNNSARNMGKNDIWLAATAQVGNLTFVTTDNDFDHLDQTFINLLKLEIK